MFESIQVATGSAGYLASNSAQLIDIASNSALAKGVYDISTGIYTIGAVICLYCGISIPFLLFKR